MTMTGANESSKKLNPEIGRTETLELNKTEQSSISDHNTLVNLIVRGKFLGELGVKEILSSLVILRQAAELSDSVADCLLGESEVRKAVLDHLRYKATVYDALYEQALKKSKGPYVDGFTRSSTGAIIPNLHNATVALANHPKYGKQFVYNEFSYQVEDKITGLSVDNETLLQLTIALQKVQGCNFDKRLIIDAITAIASTNRRYHPIKDYFATLSWDGVDRLSKAGAVYWGTKYDIENIFMRKWLISAIARIMQPGIKVDTMIVLEGKQGIGKSTSLRFLAPNPKYFLDHLPTPGDREAPIAMSGRWIVEMSELAAIKGAKNIEKIKAFLTHQIDTYRLFGVGTIANNPRVCVFAGTTNSSAYLQDPTGNRRFWPVFCHSINTDAIQRDRDQIWAQALHDYTTKTKADEDHIWWLTNEEIALHAPLALDKVEHTITDVLLEQWLDGYRYIAGAGMVKDEDPMVSRIREAGGRRDRFTVVEMALGIGMDVNKSNLSLGMLYKPALDKAGYVSGIFKRNGKVVRGWLKR